MGDYLTMTSPEYAPLITDHFAISGWDGVRCVAAAGIVSLWPGRALAWALLGKNINPKNMLQLTRKVRSAMDIHPAKRIETVVNSDFQEGHRWARLLGMECECARMRCHGIHGQDEAMYARIK